MEYQGPSTTSDSPSPVLARPAPASSPPAVDCARHLAAAGNRPRWWTLITCWLRPGRKAPLVAQVTLRRAFVVHLAAMSLLVLTVCVVADVIDHRHFGHSLAELVEEVVQDVSRDCVEALVVTVFCLIGAGVGYLVAAFVLMPWGAGDERLRDSFAHALRFVWLHSMHVVPLVLVLGLWIAAWDSARTRSSSSIPVPTLSWPQAPTPPANAAANSQAARDYQEALKKYQETCNAYQKAWSEYSERVRRAQSFYVRHGDAAICWVSIAAGVWVLWSLLRALGTRRDLPVSQRPPMCEICGYNLIATPADSRCPECGTPVVESLGPEVRSGIPWEHWRGAGRLKGWLQCMVDAILRPARLGRQIQVNNRTTHHRLSAAVPLVPLFLAWSTAIIFSYVIDTHRNPFAEDNDEEIWELVAPIFGAMATAVLFFAGLLAAALVGTVQTWQHRRNLLPAAVQMSSYLAGYLIAWGLFAAGWVVVLFWLAEQQFFESLRDQWLMDEGVIVFCFLSLPNLVWFAALLWRLWPGVRAARYANR